MILVSAEVGPFRSIDEPQDVAIDESATAFVGMNEAGKTVFLRSLEKSGDALSLAKFDPIDDYPRKDLSAYLKRSKKTGAEDVVTLRFRLSQGETAEANEVLGIALPADFEFAITHKYDNSRTIAIHVDEAPYVAGLRKDETLSSDAKHAMQGVNCLRDLPAALANVSLTAEDSAFVTALNARVAKSKWTSVVAYELWQWLSPRLPKFVYFGEYELLPSKMNLSELAQRATQAAATPKALTPEHRAVLALLRMADIEVAEFTAPGGYEPLKAKVEGVSISLTDQIMEFWRQNEDLEVEVDIRPDPDDQPPFNHGPNLYLRIRDRRHRGVSTPFRQRSRGFTWFFSFLVWFDSVQHQLETFADAPARELVLLLDEPALSLHALAQADFLRYIDRLAEKHQVLYSTHSPFMVDVERLNRVRVVEDRAGVGTVITSNVSGSNRRTLFPLQAALGWTLAQNLFISERNLLVEGPADLIYIKHVSAHLERVGRVGLREDITVVPVGGLDKLVTFIALLGANGLKLAVLHDYSGKPEQKLVDLAKAKLVSPKALLNAAQFRHLAVDNAPLRPTDTEDLFSESEYLAHFNATFKKELGGKSVKPAKLPVGDRIVERIERYLAENALQIRPSGGFNHYAVATHLASSPDASPDAQTLDCFEALFKAVNELFDKR